MKFVLESLKIRNFKGIKELDIVFDPIVTTICGENATGKTTVVDAFNWLLFEKDSKGRSQFEIKTLDENGNPIHGLKHSVEGIFEVDARKLKLKKVYKEVWTKRRGETQETFTGHEVERFVNDIPVKKNEYDAKINELIDERIFRLLTDPLYFSQQLSWKERRQVLFELAGGNLTTEDILRVNPKLSLIQQDLKSMTIEELKKTLSYQRRELNKARENIPVKIETLNSTIKEVDKTAVDIRRRSILGGINNVEEQMLDATKVGEDQLKKQDELYKLKSKLKEIEHKVQSEIKDPDIEIKKQIMDFESKLRELNTEASGEKRAIKALESSIEIESKTLDELRKDYKYEANKKIEIDDSVKECPTCKRPFSEEEIGHKIAELEENFKEHQVKELKRLRAKGQKLAKEVAEHQETLKQEKSKQEETEEKIQTLKEAIHNRKKLLGTRPKADLQTLLTENEEYQKTMTETKKIEMELQNYTLKQHTSALADLKDKKTKLEQELREVEKFLHQNEINKETKEKIQELKEEEKELSQKISEIEKKEFIADEFISTKAELIEKSINEKFNKVSFKLFKRQVNGVLDETCEVLVDGVPFDNANTAGQVNAGLDIINSLCRHYDIYTPIFIDNRESVNELIDTDLQLINLKVTKHKNLRVETE